MNFVDLLILFVIALGIYAEARRGLSFALFDILRIILGLGMGLVGYSLVFRVFHSYVAGLVAFMVVAVAFVGLLAFLLKRSGIDPGWGTTAPGRIAAGMIGCLLGAAICLVLIPVLGRFGEFRKDVSRAPLAQPFVRMMPSLYAAADAMDIDLPQLNRRAIHFEDEGHSAKAAFAERVNFSRLNGSMCIECRTPVRFQGYRMKIGMSVSPLFICPNCGRTSDGCQTFEGFHKMYHHCPIEVAKGRIAIDCGVWPNNRPVQPIGQCPVCGRIGAKLQGRTL
jgi:hypothetical protein